MSFLLVALGSAIGGSMRYGLSLLLMQYGANGIFTPVFFVNLIGCFVAGVLLSLLQDSPIKLFLGVGILGGFTTFASFGVEFISLLLGGQVLHALSYVALTNLFGLLLVYGGFLLGGVIIP